MEREAGQALGASPIYQLILDVQAKVAAIQEAETRKIALRLLGEETGDPTELMRQLQAKIRALAGDKASLVWCVVEFAALAPGVLHESCLAIDTGVEGTHPVRIGPIVRIDDGTPRREA